MTTEENDIRRAALQQEREIIRQRDNGIREIGLCRDRWLTESDKGLHQLEKELGTQIDQSLEELVKGAGWIDTVRGFPLAKTQVTDALTERILIFARVRLQELHRQMALMTPPIAPATAENIRPPQPISDLSSMRDVAQVAGPVVVGSAAAVYGGYFAVSTVTTGIIFTTTATVISWPVIGMAGLALGIGFILSRSQVDVVRRRFQERAASVLRHYVHQVLFTHGYKDAETGRRASSILEQFQQESQAVSEMAIRWVRFYYARLRDEFTCAVRESGNRDRKANEARRSAAEQIDEVFQEVQARLHAKLAQEGYLR